MRQHKTTQATAGIFVYPEDEFDRELYHMTVDFLKNNGYKVTWVVGEKGVDVVKNNPAVDETIFIPWKKWKKQDLNGGKTALLK